MKMTTLREQWKDYENLVPTKRIKEALRYPEGELDEEILNILPNIELGTDGPIVQSVILFTANYIGEARLRDNEQDVDFAIKNTVSNYRIQLGIHEIVRNAAAIEAAKAAGESAPAPEKTTYQTATVKLRHSQLELVTEINYFGQDRRKWLERVRAVVPLAILKESH